MSEKTVLRCQYGFSELDEIIEGLGGKAVREIEIYEKHQNYKLEVLQAARMSGDEDDSG